jgi:hypothetical protein
MAGAELVLDARCLCALAYTQCQHVQPTVVCSHVPSPAPGGPIKIILTLSCAVDEPPPWPENRPSSSAMRCSSL